MPTPKQFQVSTTVGLSNVSDYGGGQLGARKLVLVRINELPDRTLGRLLAYDESVELGRWWTLELPWKNNAHNISCIPASTYRVSPESNEHLGWFLRVHGVLDRDGILMHAANLPTQILGCIACGMILQDVNKDGILDSARSREAMAEIKVWFGKGDAELHIVEAF